MTSERPGTAPSVIGAADGAELATATGVYVAADATRKQELQTRYGFRRLEVVPAGVAR